MDPKKKQAIIEDLANDLVDQIYDSIVIELENLTGEASELEWCSSEAGDKNYNALIKAIKERL